MKSNLPIGWSVVKIGDILSLSGGGTPSKHVTKYWNGNIFWASVKDVKGKYLTQTQDTITEEGLKASATQLAEPGSVLMVTRMAPGRPIITKVKTAINQDLKIVRPKLPLSPLFIYYAFLNYERKFLEIASGTTVQGIRVQDIYELEIPFPPLAEQERIVAQLEATMQKLEASQERLEKLPKLLKKFRQAVLVAAVSGKLTEAWRAEQPQGETAVELLNRIRLERHVLQQGKGLGKSNGNQLALSEILQFDSESAEVIDTHELPELPEGWIYDSVGNSIKIIDYRGRTPPFSGNDQDIPHLRSSNVKRGKIIWNDLAYVTEEVYAEFMTRGIPKVGDVLLTSEAPLGEVAMVPDQKFSLAQRMMVLRPLPGLNSEFIKIQFMSEVVQTRLRNRGTGTMVTGIAAKHFKPMAIAIPPQAEQEEIVRQVNHYFDLADQLEVRFEQAAALVEQLPQALLAKAFSGQLVPQDPNDEPAIDLLERLRSGGAAPAKSKRGRKAQPEATPLFE
ncbi:restriction endonuclease subunit S [Hymenobacter nivis]|uniref:Type I restriction modification DNA specificity domain-containing protein n=1 Tax=Hymenobacter nivis TaxID=1850093 RepID=A0A2Z3GLR5_9BACT|nr:restriction endonuclease subunit S [Hymenobacter nivis]AWM32126.1 hypothetical protein DDQ68_04545 [Hymenobacter nivis]